MEIRKTFVKSGYIPPVDVLKKDVEMIKRGGDKQWR